MRGERTIRVRLGSAGQGPGVLVDDANVRARYYRSAGIKYRPTDGTGCAALSQGLRHPDKNHQTDYKATCSLISAYTPP